MSENENEKLDAEVEDLKKRAEELKPPVITFEEFLEKKSPDETYRINNLLIEMLHAGLSAGRKFNTPPVQLFCKTESCNGIRTFDCKTRGEAVNYDDAGSKNLFYIYECRNCKEDVKKFALRASYGKRGILGTLIKYGELPKFGLPEPTQLTKLIKDPNDLDLFNKGFDCENQGKGIGAFTYYRRMVDSVKDQLIDEIAKAVKIIDSEHEMLKNLEDAKKEKRFKEAIDKIKDTLPKELFIGKVNPLTALYNALSGGVHELSDGECQDKAHDIRLVLTELFERTQFMMADKKSISEAVHRLINSEK